MSKIVLVFYHLFEYYPRVMKVWQIRILTYSILGYLGLCAAIKFDPMWWILVVVAILGITANGIYGYTKRR